MILGLGLFFSSEHQNEVTVSGILSFSFHPCFIPYVVLWTRSRFFFKFLSTFNFSNLLIVREKMSFTYWILSRD